jgi:hypothetical protein
VRRLIASVEPADGQEANWNWRNSLEEGLDICGTLKRRGHLYNGHPVSECESKHNNPPIPDPLPLVPFCSGTVLNLSARWGSAAYRLLLRGVFAGVTSVPTQCAVHCPATSSIASGPPCTSPDHACTLGRRA